jgi:hypothetical protein
MKRRKVLDSGSADAKAGKLEGSVYFIKADAGFITSDGGEQFFFTPGCNRGRSP